MSLPTSPAHSLKIGFIYPYPSVAPMDEWNIKTPNPKCWLFIKIDLWTEFAALCLTDFLDWRYIHSLVGIFWPSLWTVAPMDEGTIFVYCCPSIFSLTSPPSPLPKLNVQYIQTDSVCLRGGVELCCRPYSAGILHSVSDQIQNQPNCFTTPNKMASEDDMKGLVSLKFLRPWLPLYSE